MSSGEASLSGEVTLTAWQRACGETLLEAKKAAESRLLRRPKPGAEDYLKAVEEINERHLRLDIIGIAGGFRHQITNDKGLVYYYDTDSRGKDRTYVGTNNTGTEVLPVSQSEVIGTFGRLEKALSNIRSKALSSGKPLFSK